MVVGLDPPPWSRSSTAGPEFLGGGGGLVGQLPHPGRVTGAGGGAGGGLDERAALDREGRTAAAEAGMVGGRQSEGHRLLVPVGFAGEDGELAGCLGYQERSSAASALWRARSAAIHPSCCSSSLISMRVAQQTALGQQRHAAPARRALRPDRQRAVDSAARHLSTCFPDQQTAGQRHEMGAAGGRRRSPGGHGDASANGNVAAGGALGAETRFCVEALAQALSLVAGKTAQGPSPPRVSRRRPGGFGST
ncbi:hypothetical protein [Streptomyces triculaminicus]|uniref:hypothetical protein n=1 Tax=Streptomyces triculaminicus TaxID=2816232 RepID=UPI0037D7A9F9